MYMHLETTFSGKYINFSNLRIQFYGVNSKHEKPYNLLSVLDHLKL